MTRRVRPRLLARLVAGEGRIVTDEALLAAMYGDDADGSPATATARLRVHIHNLRKTLPPGAITCHRGVGYSLCPEVVKTLPPIDARELVPRGET